MMYVGKWAPWMRKMGPSTRVRVTFQQLSGVVAKSGLDGRSTMLYVAEYCIVFHTAWVLVQYLPLALRPASINVGLHGQGLLTSTVPLSKWKTAPV